MNERDMRRFFGDGPSFRVRGTRQRRKRSGVGMFAMAFGTLLGSLLMFKLLTLAVVAAIGGFFFDYSLMAIFTKDIPWYADCIVGLVTCPVAVAVGLGCWVAVLCDVETPFVPGTPLAAEAPMDPTNG